jgi:hypothetical protein
VARVISLLTVYYNGEVFFRNEPINKGWKPEVDIADVKFGMGSDN